MTHAFFAWEIAADTHLLELQLLQNRVFRTIGNFPRRQPVRDLHTTFNLPSELCRQQAEVIQNHENNPRSQNRTGEARHRKYKRLKLGGGRAYDCSID
jgi:hypothetical protein